MARAPHVLAIDQGTTNTKAQLIAQSGAVVAYASRPVPIAFPRPGWVEQDPDAIWQSVAGAAAECLARAPAAALAAIGISNQRESALVWDRRTGRPLGPCITWQCRRTAPLCDALRERGLEQNIQAVTGLPIDPLFSASKAAWLLDQIDPDRARATRGDVCVGTVDSWLVWQLTGRKVHATDVTNASRTQLLDLHRVEWDDALLGLFNIPRACVAEVRGSSGDFGCTAGGDGLPAGVTIAGVIGDSHGALFGHAATPGATKATYGTGSSLMTPLPSGVPPLASRHGLASTIAWAFDVAQARAFDSPQAGGRLDVMYALEGNITNTGGAVQWVGELLGLEDSAAVSALAAQVPDAGGVYLVPAFAGLGAPYWDADARGAFVGLTRGSTRARLARAAIDAIAHQVCDVLDAMAADLGTLCESVAAMHTLLADGGASRNAQLMQRQADLAACTVQCDGAADVAARGAAWLAGLSVGVWDSLESLARQPRDVVSYRPALDAVARERDRAGWRDAVSRTRVRT